MPVVLCLGDGRPLGAADVCRGAAQVGEMEIDELVVTLGQEEQFWFDVAVPGCAATAIVEVT